MGNLGFGELLIVAVMFGFYGLGLVGLVLGVVGFFKARKLERTVEELRAQLASKEN